MWGFLGNVTNNFSNILSKIATRQTKISVEQKSHLENLFLTQRDIFQNFSLDFISSQQNVIDSISIVNQNMKKFAQFNNQLFSLIQDNLQKHFEKIEDHINEVNTTLFNYFVAKHTKQEKTLFSFFQEIRTNATIRDMNFKKWKTFVENKIDSTLDLNHRTIFHLENYSKPSKIIFYLFGTCLIAFLVFSFFYFCIKPCCKKNVILRNCFLYVCCRTC